MISDPLPMLRRLTCRLIADALQVKPMSPSDLGVATGLPEQSILAGLSELQGGGWISTDDYSASGGLLRLAADTELALGVDVGGTKIAAAIADVSGVIRAEKAEPTDPRGGMHVVEQVHRMAGSLAKSAGLPAEKMRSATIGFPGAIHPSAGRISLSPNIRDLERIDLRSELGALLGADVALENDVNLAMLGEAACGCAKGRSSAAFLALGTGTGLGIMIDGRMVRGATGGAGEIAYLPIGSDLTSSEALRVGAFEKEAGSLTMLARYQQSGDPAVGSVREVFDRFNTGDPVSHAVVDETARVVALGITALQAILDLELIVLGGSIGVRAELVQRVHAALKTVLAAPVELAVSSLHTRAGLVGAVEAAAGHLRDKAFGPPVPQIDGNWSLALSAVTSGRVRGLSAQHL